MTALFAVTIDDVDKTADVLTGTKLNLRLNAWNQLSICFKDFHVAYNSMAYAVKIINNRSGQTLFTGISRQAEISFPAKSYHEAPMNCSDFISVYFTYDKYSYDYSAGDHTEKQFLDDTIGTISPSPIGAYVIDGVAVAQKFTGSWERIISDLAAINNRLWYWDGDNQLHYFASTGETAPFGLSDSPNNTTTYPYAYFDIKKDFAGDSSVTLGGSLICWKDGLWPGMAVEITNAHLGITAQTVIINEVEVELVKGDVGFQYTIHFGQAKKPRMTDYIIRSNQTASNTDLGLAPKCINDTTKYLRSDGTYATPPGTGTDIATDEIWDAKGDLVAGTGSNASVRLPVGADGYFLKANSSKTMGLEWVAAGAGHDQNKDWILLDGSGGSQLFAGGHLKTTLYVDANQIISGVGYITLESTMASGQVLIRSTGNSSSIILDNYSKTGATITVQSYGNIGLLSAAGSLVLPLKTADPTGTEGAIYYHSVNHVIRHYNGTVWADIGGMANPMTERGSIIYEGISAPAELLHGVVGQLLCSGGHGADPAWITPYLDQMANPTDITNLNATISAHGLLPKLGGGTTNFLRADGTWAAPPAGHTQNTDYILLDAASGNQLFASGYLKKTLYVDANQIISGSGNITLQSANGQVLIRNTATGTIVLDNYSYSGSSITIQSYGNILLYSVAGSLVLPLRTSDPAGTTGAIYYNSTNHVLRHYTGSAWADVGNTHSQNTDWILKMSNGGSSLIDSGNFIDAINFTSSGRIQTTEAVGLYITQGSRGILWSAPSVSGGHIFLSNQTVPGAYLQVCTNDILYLYSVNKYVEIDSNIGVRMPVIAADPTTCLVNGLIYYNYTANKLRWYNGSAWADIGGSGHAQNTDTILTTNGSTALFNAGYLKTTLNVDANQIINGAGYITLQSSGGQVLIRNINAGSIMLDNYSYSGSSITIQSYGNINLFSASGSLVLPLKSGDPAGTTGAIYYNSSTSKLRHYNGSAWADVGGSSHTQNTDWVLLRSNGGSALISSGNFVDQINFTANAYIVSTEANGLYFMQGTRIFMYSLPSGSGGHLYFVNNSIAGAFIELYSNDTLYLWSANKHVELNSNIGARMPVIAADPASYLVTGLIYYNSATSKLRWYNGSAWADIGGGSGHTQNTDTILTTNGSTALFNAGSLKTTLNVDANQIINGAGYITLQSSGGQVLIRNINAGSIVLDNYSYSGSWITIQSYGNINLFSSTGSLVLPLKSGDPTGVTGAIYYNSSTGKLRHYNGSVWADVSGSGGGTPAISVTSETTYGIAAAVGVSTNYARQDHTHGSPPVVSTTMSTFTVASRTTGVTYTNGGNIRIVHVYLYKTGTGGTFAAYAGGTLAAKAQNNYDGGSMTFVVGKNQQYYITGLSSPFNDYQWTEWDITNI